MKQTCIIGTGYASPVACAWFARLGNIPGIDHAKIDRDRKEMERSMTASWRSEQDGIPS